MELSIELRKKIIAFLKCLPGIQSESARNALIFSAALDQELVSQINFWGAADQFCEILITTLLQYGKLHDGRYALESLIEAAKDKVGTDIKISCEQILEELRAVRNEKPTNLPFAELSACRQYYLNTLLERVSYLRMSYISSIQNKRVNLENVYVHLPTDLALSINIQDYHIIDWEVNNSSEISKVSSKIRFSRSDSFNYHPLSVHEIVEELQAFIDGREGKISIEEKRRPLILAPLWANGLLKNHTILNMIEVASIATPLVVLGFPGSGKSTFAQYLTLTLAKAQLNTESAYILSEKLGRWSHGALTPIFIELRDFVNWAGFPDINKPATADHFWEYIYEQQLGPNKGFADELWDDLITGKAVIIFDGIDEVPFPLEQSDAQQLRHNQIIELALSLKIRFYKSRIIFTSRPYAYEMMRYDFENNGYSVVNLVPLNKQRMLQLSRNLYKGIGLNEQDADRNSKSLISELESVSDYLKNRPLFLTLMAILFIDKEDRKLPSQKGVLLHESVFLLLDRWTQHRFPVDSYRRLNKEETKELYYRLENIAYRAQNHASVDIYKTTDIDVGELYRELEIYRNRMFEVVDYLTHQAGIFEPTAPKVFRFAHRTFQEFLTASYLVRSGDFERIRLHIQNQPVIWRETSLLMGDLLAQKGDEHLWAFVSALLDYIIPSENEKNLQHWHAIWLASSTIIHQKMYTRIQQYALDIIDNLVSKIRRLLDTPSALATEPAGRVEVACTLGFLGDDRPGTGVKNGIPDIVWSLIPAGKFLMGTSKQQIQEMKNNSWAKEWSFERETPSCVVYLPEYYISKYPITRIQFQAFVEAEDGYSNKEWWSNIGWELSKKLDPPTHYNSKDGPLNLPQGNVNWFEAIAFCNWFGNKLGERIHLPTEAEWEKAARGEDGRIFSWGNEFDPSLCNVADSNIGRPSPVGCFPIVNPPWGSISPLDMCGNVWEWCTSICEKEGGILFKYPYNNDDGREELDMGDEYLRIVRGGSYTNIPFLARTSTRGRDRPSFRHTRQGFRIVLAPK